MARKNLIQTIRDWWNDKEPLIDLPPNPHDDFGITDNQLNNSPVSVGAKGQPNLPNRRSSKPSSANYSEVLSTLGNTVKVISPGFNRIIIPVIRKLVQTNPDLGQALDNYVTLGNTNHRILFDRNIPDEYVAKMRNHIINKHKEWSAGAAGAHGLVNRMFSQILISGALSNEWVPNLQRNSVEACVFVNPEQVVAGLNARKTGYDWYQMPEPVTNANGVQGNLIKLNPHTYKYYALNGDGDTPYGFPPYMAAMDRICTQLKMNANIDHVTDMLGILGFLEVLVTVSDQDDDESDGEYKDRVVSYLNQAKDAMLQGMKEGVLVGVNGMHSFNFNSVAKDFDKVIDLYKNNELQLLSGAKMDPSLMGRDYNTSESQIGVIFMKMISQLKNIQSLIKTNLEFGYAMELRLAGFNFNYLTVEFDRSTIQDDLKYQQAEEIKIRNVLWKFLLGTISTTQAANELGYESPDQLTPRLAIELLAGKSQAQKEEDREKDKDKSDKKGRDKQKPQGSKK